MFLVLYTHVKIYVCDVVCELSKLLHLSFFSWRSILWELKNVLGRLLAAAADFDERTKVVIKFSNNELESFNSKHAFWKKRIYFIGNLQIPSKLLNNRNQLWYNHIKFLCRRFLRVTVVEQKIGWGTPGTFWSILAVQNAYQYKV